MFIFCMGTPVLLLAADSNEARQTQQQLEDQVNERTAELAAAKNEAEAANESKSRFLAATSHDLRQPLHTMGLYLGALEASVEQEKHRETVAKIAASQETLADMLDQLLDISRIDAGDIAVATTEVELQPLLERATGVINARAAEKSLTIEVQATDAIVRSDPVLLERIVSNLLENAVKYTETGTVGIVCRRENTGLELEVQDTGIGIEASQLTSIFEEFRQLGNPERNRSKGLGLGLAIVSRLAQALDHPIAVHSTPAVGSRFILTLPLVKA